MNIDIIDFDTYNNHKVKKIRLTNDHSVSVGILNMGAILHEFSVPTATGSKNLILNFGSTAEYFDNPYYVGMAIGRTAGRIKNGKMPLGDTIVTLPPSEGNNTHQGGPHGFYTHMWDFETETTNDYVATTLSHTISATDDGFPGDIDVKITYRLTNNNEFSITYSGKATADTFFNPTCHAYFNLSDSSTILNHQLMVNSDTYLEVDQEKIPTGNFLPVADTAFDFTSPKLLQSAINDLSNTDEKGLDDIFKLNTDQQPIAKLQDLDSGDCIEINSSRNGLVVYTANNVGAGLKFERGAGVPYIGVALEAQTLPDTHNHPDFGDITLKANTEKEYQITYKYSHL
jgi:aldose 1-epimerase